MIFPLTPFILSLLPLTSALVKSPFGDKALKGFNFGPESDFATEFKAIKNTPGIKDFTSAKLFTSIAPGTTNKPLDAAFRAAQENEFSLLLGIWASGSETHVDDEIAAIKAAMNADYGKDVFSKRIVGIIVGSEDLYRRSKIGTADEGKLEDLGLAPDIIIKYIDKVRTELSTTPYANKIPVGHADTWGSWMNDAEGGKVMEHVDFIALNGFPYWEQQQASWGKFNWEGALKVTKDAAQRHKNNGEVVPVWSTETGWPAAGPDCGKSKPGKENAQIYWKTVGCDVQFGKISSWWFQYKGEGAQQGVDKDLQWGVVDAQGNPFYPLSCDAELPEEVLPTKGATCGTNEAKQPGT